MIILVFNPQLLYIHLPRLKQCNINNTQKEHTILNTVYVYNKLSFNILH